MKTVGQILQENRIKKNLNLDQVADSTKIRPIYLQALEEDDYQKLPSLTSTRGFLKNYAEFLGLSSETILAVFRRDFDISRAEKESWAKATLINRPRFTWKPKFTTIAVLAILGLLFIIYLIWQYRSLVSAPYY